MLSAPGLSLNFLKKENYPGSCCGTRYYLIKSENVLKICTYPDLWCFEKTPDEQKSWAEFPFSQEGLDQALQWIEKQVEEKRSFRTEY